LILGTLFAPYQDICEDAGQKGWKFGADLKKGIICLSIIYVAIIPNLIISGRTGIIAVTGPSHP
jgi:hypothetical protein